MNVKKYTNNTWREITPYKYGTSVETYTDLPQIIYANGTNASVGLKGNMSQTGTPSSTTPIQPQECGERTGNLVPNTGWEYGQYVTGVWEYTTGRMTSPWIPIEGGNAYYLSINDNGDNLLSWINLNYFDENKQWLGNRVTLGMEAFSPTSHFIPTPAFPNDAKYLRVVIRGYNESATPTPQKIIDSNIQVNKTAVHLPYSPYGYKLDISSGGENLLDLSKIVAGKLMNDTGSVAYAAQTTYLSVSGDSVTVTTSSTWRGFVSDYIPTEDRLRVSIGSLSNVSDNVTLTGYFYYYDKDKNYLGYGSVAPEGTKYSRISFQFNTQVELAVASNIMLNLGSTAKPYSPYNRTTTPIYLGEVPTTRQVKKIDLGTLNWSKTASGNFWSDTIIENIRIISNSETGNALCDSFKEVTAENVASTPYSFSSCLNVRARPFINKTGFENMSGAEFKEAMSGVYMYYVLATSTTGILNEPLRKIGTYADTLSVSQTIPTVEGENLIDVETTLKPSEVMLDYKGWHKRYAKKYPSADWKAGSWSQFRDIVRMGEAASLYPVGTVLYESWGDNTSTAWQVMGYDLADYMDSELTAQGFTHNVVLYEVAINNLRVFDAKEAWLYAETAIPAGAYRFTIPNYDTSYGGGKTYIFTSTATVPVGGQLTLTWAYNANPTKVQGYSEATSTSALFDVTISEWDGETACTDLGTIKLAMSDADSTYGKLNHIHRARYGSNNYAQSGIRQWLNSDGASGTWWTPSNIFDRPYDNRNTAGRLNALNTDLKAVISQPTINCITNNLFETGYSLQTAYTVKDKLFLLTHTELNLSSSPNVGSVLPYYTGAQNADRIKYRADNGNAYTFWLRTPNPSHGSYERSVYSSGALNNNSASGSHGGVSACAIQ